MSPFYSLEENTFLKSCSKKEGYFFMPLTDTCLRLKARVRSDYIASVRKKDIDRLGFRVRGSLYLDTLTTVNNEDLSTFLEFEFNHFDNINLAKGYILWSGVTAGKTSSFFDYYIGYYNYATLRGSDSRHTVLGYSYKLNSETLLMLSLEDPSGRFLTYSAQNNSFLKNIKIKKTLPDIVFAMKVEKK